MVEIVGTDEKLVLQRSCGNCASRLRFTRSETTSRRLTDYTGSTSEILDSIKCPKCNAWVDI